MWDVGIHILEIVVECACWRAGLGSVPTKETKPYQVCRKERSQNGAGCVEEPLVRLASLGTYPQSGKITGGPVCRPYEI